MNVALNYSNMSQAGNLAVMMEKIKSESGLFVFTWNNYWRIVFFRKAYLFFHKMSSNY